ncbi:5-hydroxytryptamine receptor 1D-like [Diadema setosum]|uniref:5-hydroxytryptamine receptor 1D-like n=1 Tax=Diadema setosum TaxID=31175 RepID=UPI003B3AEED3
MNCAWQWMHMGYSLHIQTSSTSLLLVAFLAHPMLSASEAALTSPSPWDVELFSNVTDNNDTVDVGILFAPLPAAALISLFSLIILATIFGNVLVILSVCKEKKLQTPPNILIINLALADLAVALLVMPFQASFDILSGRWIFSQAICDMFICFDVMCCTASIVDLVFISVDRYLAITRPFRYARHRTSRLMIGMVAIIWLVSGFISFSPLFIFGNEHQENGCLLSQDPIYTIYSTFAAFYIPLFIMVVLYYKIYRAAGELERKELQRRPSTPGLLPRGSVMRSGSVSSDSDSMPDNCREVRRKSSIVRFTEYVRSVSRNSLASVQFGRNRISLKLERKASKTLGIIMGAFVVCWIPFSILAFTRAFCQCNIPPALHSTFAWLGYVNSMLNPIIYPFFNKDFGPAYRKMLGFTRCKACPERFGYDQAKTTPPRRYSLNNHQHAMPSPELHAIAEDSHDDSEVGDHKVTAEITRSNALGKIDERKYDAIHLDKLNGNSKISDNRNDVTATHV